MSFWKRHQLGCISIMEGIFPFDDIYDRYGDSKMNRLGLQLMTNNRMDSKVIVEMTSDVDFL